MNAPLPYEEALTRILTSVGPLPSALCPLESTLGAVAAADISAPIDLPPFDNSAMDGFAVRASDTAEASGGEPVYLHIVGECAAGEHAPPTVGPGQATRIFTGAMIPPGADAVVPVEEAVRARFGDWIGIASGVAPGASVRNAGSDVRRGDRAVSAGEEMTARRIGLLAALGIAELPVTRSPVVAVIGTGDELVLPGQGPLRPGRIYNSNVYALAAQVRAAGCQVAAISHAADDPESVRAVLDEAAPGADVIVTSGGVSVGDRDFVRAVVEGRGDLDFWRVAVRPGKPFCFGQYAGRLFFGLPGNPVSSMVTFELFVRPALRRLSGHSESQSAPTFVRAVLEREASHEPGRRSFQRAFAAWRDGQLRVSPLDGQSSHQLGSLASANALLVIPEERSRLMAGDVADILILT